jgi:riboflavin synthase
MFTGIVRTKTRLSEIRTNDDGSTLCFDPGVLDEVLQVGQSVAVDGVCLTVARRGEGWVEVEATPETLRRTNLGRRRVGDFVNLEPPVGPGDVFGGHLVQGHVDATGEVLSIREEGNSWIFRFSCPPEVRRYCVLKGSVTVNGISLTISGLGEDWFEVAIIPHTWEVTNLSDVGEGDVVNLEADIVGKYVESHVLRYLDLGVGVGLPGSGSVSSR